MKFIKIISINLFVFIICLLIIEFVFVKYNANKIKCSYLLCNYNVTYDNHLYETVDKIIYKKDKYGFRGRTNNVSEIDIIVFGGSTTDERYLNLEDTWIEQLEKSLKEKNIKLDIVNAGIDGQSTFGHIWNFNNWINKIENLKTKYIFFYIGINEGSFPGLFELNKEEYKNTSLKNKIKFNVKNNNAFLYDLYKAYIKIKILLGIKSNPGHKSMTSNLNNFYLDEVCDSSGCRVSIDYTKQENFEKEFEKRLEKLTFLTKKFGAEPVFVTQRSFRWFKKNGKIFNYKKRQVYQSEKLRRDIIMDYCFKNNLFCIDVFNKLDLKIKDTYDLVHLTPSGSKKLAATIEKEILKNRIFFDKIKNVN